MTPQQIALYQDIARNLNSAPYGTKTALVSTTAERIGISTSQLYDRLTAVGYESGRKTRSDKGDTHICITDAMIVCNIIHQTRRKNDKRETTFKNAIKIAHANGEIKQMYNEKTLAKIASDNGFHPDQLAAPTPHQNLKSLHPNHVWQVDASIGTIYFLEGGGVAWYNEREHYKNKPANIEKASRMLCIRYVATDHASGSIFTKYYAASGETQAILYDFIADAFSVKDYNQMHGVPFILIMDKGSANIAHTVTSFLDKLNVINFPHAVGNSRAKGSVEKAQDIVEREFEGGLKLMKTRVTNVDELNHYAQRWQKYFNETAVHTRTKETRFNVWMRIKEHQLRLAPSRETMDMLLTSKPQERTVRGDMTITFKGRGFAEYKCYSVGDIPNVRVKEKVLVSVNPYRAPNVDVIMFDLQGNQTLYECEPLEIDDLGFYEKAAAIGIDMKSPKDTATDSVRKAMLKEAYDGAETLTEAYAKEKKGTQLFNGRINPHKHINDYLAANKNVATLPKSGVPMEIEAPKTVSAKLTIAETCKRMQARLGDAFPKDTYSRLNSNEKYKEGIDPADIEAMIEQIKKPKPILKVIGK